MEEFVVIILVIFCLICLCFIVKNFCNEEHDTDSVYLNVVSRNRHNSQNSNYNPDSNQNTNYEIPNITLNNLVKENIKDIIGNNSFCYVSETKDINCIICLDDIEKGEEIRTLRCMHKFHKECIDSWLERQHLDNLICPICDSSIIDFDDMHP